MKRHMFAGCLLVVLGVLLISSVPCEKNRRKGAADLSENICNCMVGVGHKKVIDIVGIDSSGYNLLVNNLGFIAFYINSINSEYSMQDMKKLASIINRRGIPVIFEIGGVLGPGWGKLTDKDNGKESAQVEIQNSRNWVKAGGRIDYVIFDGPVRRLLFGDATGNMQANKGVLVSGYFNTTRGPFSYQEAADEILISMKEWRAVYPQVKFILGCNFPNWGWKGKQEYHKRGPDGMFFGDYWDVIQLVMSKVQTSQTRFSGLIVDFPYNYAIGVRPSPIQGNNPSAVDWIARIRELEDYVKEHGLDFYLYTNTEEQLSEQVYSEGTLSYVDLYRQRGGHPNGWLVQSWYPVPARFGPDEQRYSMSWLVNEVYKKLNPK
jgi:hypothetical protein